VWEAAIDASFMLDIFLNFRTGIVEVESGDALVIKPSIIALKYIRGFFFIDLVSTVPWDVIVVNGAVGLMRLVKATKVVKLVRIMRVLKLVRVLRILKAPAIIKQLEEIVGRMLVRIAALAVSVILILHISASRCLNEIP
jgi:hyperpolarization activated cyclic nucleotide-gated potassium channel 2